MSCSKRGHRLVTLLAVALAGGGVVSAGEPERLTQDGRLKKDPVFVEGGEAIVFAVTESPERVSLMRLRLADRSVERLHPQAPTSEFEAAFSPDGRWCAFVQQREVTNVKLVIQDLRGNKEAIFDPGSDRAHLGCPSIAPDASRIIFSLPAPGGQQIVSVNMQGQDRRLLTNNSGIHNWPTFSPDGKRIAFSSSRDGDFEIYVMNADGSDVRRLTASRGRDIRPSWSPDGRRIAFTSARDGDEEVYVMDADGSGLVRVTHHPERDGDPIWHPDGRRLVTVSERDGQFDLYLVEVRR